MLESDGTLTVYMGSSGVGQGLETAFAQIAADAMEMPMERINRVFHGSTAYVSDGYGAYHSRSIVMGGSAILDAAKKLREVMRAQAARRLNCAAGEVVLADERANGPDGKSVAWAELAPEPISVEGAFLNHKHTWAYGAHAAHVAVDIKTGHVALIDYVAVENCGRMINPLTLKGQLVGAAVQGLGGTFLEHLAYDENGQLLTGSLADYLIPDRERFPEDSRLRDGISPVSDQSARRQGRRRRRHHLGWRRDRQCRRRRAVFIAGRAARPAVDAKRRLAARSGRPKVARCIH